MNYLKSFSQAAAGNFYIPKREDFPLTKDKLNKWYSNLLREVSLNNYPEWASGLLQDKTNYYGKYIDPGTRQFFLNHFARNLAETMAFLIGRSDADYKILEIGSGCGNQLVLMALSGAEVIGCDVRQDVCDLVEKRKKLYEEISGRKLNISLVREDVFKINWGQFGKFDAINFLFSFNNLNPNEKMLQLVDMLLKPGGRVVFQETNPSNYYNRIFRKRDAMTPRQVAEALKKINFIIHSLKGGYALPPVFWRILPGNMLAHVDQVLCKSLFMSPSYHLMAEKI